LQERNIIHAEASRARVRRYGSSRCTRRRTQVLDAAIGNRVETQGILAEDGPRVTREPLGNIDLASSIGEQSAAIAEQALTEAPRRSTARWWTAVATGLVVSAPLSWLLSYGALLPFYLGLFFFALFGIVIGASVFRVASPVRPIGRWSVFSGTTVIVLTCWGFSLVKESRDFPGDMAQEAIGKVRDIGGRSAAEYRANVEEAVVRFLEERFPPGGTLGYVRWSLSSGELKKGEIEGVPVSLRRPQGPVGWAVRVVLSIALLGFGVASQTFALRTSPETALSSPQSPLRKE